MNDSTASEWRIEFVGGTREGYFGYYEGNRAISFYWELGGYGLVIHVGRLSEWRKLYPWAADRQPEILQRVTQHFTPEGSTVVKAEIETRGDGYTYLHIGGQKKEPDPQEAFDRARAKYIADGSLVISDTDSEKPATPE